MDTNEEQQPEIQPGPVARYLGGDGEIRLDDSTYREARSRLASDRSDQAKFIDQTVLTLAGGALGLTLTFLHDFLHEPTAAPLL